MLERAAKDTGKIQKASQGMRQIQGNLRRSKSTCPLTLKYGETIPRWLQSDIDH